MAGGALLGRVIGPLAGRILLIGANKRTPLIEPILTLQSSEFHGLEALQRRAAVNELGCVKPLDGLGECIVTARAETANRRFNPGFRPSFRISNRDILAAPVAVMDQAAAMQGPPVMQSLLQRIKHEPRMRRAADTPADDPAGKGIDDEGDIDKASPGRDGAFSSQAERLAARKMRPGGRRHFQAKRNAWRRGKCDQTNMLKSETQSRFGAAAWNFRLT